MLNVGSLKKCHTVLSLVISAVPPGIPTPVHGGGFVALLGVPAGQL